MILNANQERRVSAIHVLLGVQLLLSARSHVVVIHQLRIHYQSLSTHWVIVKKLTARATWRCLNLIYPIQGHKEKTVVKMSLSRDVTMVLL